MPHLNANCSSGRYTSSAGCTGTRLTRTTNRWVATRERLSRKTRVPVLRFSIVSFEIHLTFGVALLIALTAACGTLTAPISFVADGSPADTRSREDTSVTITPVEGQPRGLLLEITARKNLPKDGALEVVRRIDDGQTETIRTIELSTSRLARLADSGLQFLDRSVAVDETHHYRVLYVPPSHNASSRDDRVDFPGSPPVSVHWQSPPSRPTQLDATQTGRAIELHWRPTSYGAVVFRRNVLAERSEMRRIATVGPGARGRFVDRTAAPDGVYAYQIALAREDGQLPQFGQPSDPLYVSLE